MKRKRGLMKINIEEELNTIKTEKLIIQYALPAIISGLIGAFYNIIDQIFIGHIVGTQGNAATNVAFPLVTLTTAVMLLIGIGATANFSISLGQKNIENAKKFLGIILYGAPIIGVLISCFTLLFLEPLLHIFGATQSSFELAKTYVSITALGYPLWITTEAATKVMRADGSPKQAMVCTVTGAILNCFLNPLFMKGFDLGIQGAALATVTGQLVSFILTIHYFTHFNTFAVKLKEIIPNVWAIKRTLFLGFAACINQIVMMCAQIVMNNVYAHYGEMSIYGADIPLACVGIITKVNAMYMAVMVGIAQGVQSLLGYCYGAGNYKKVKEIFYICLKYACGISLLVFFVFQLFPRQILSLFGAKGDLFFQFGVSYFRVFMLMTFLNGIQPISFNLFTALGKPIKSTVISLSKQLVLLIPLVIILPMYYGLEGVLYAGPIADIMAFFIALYFIVGEVKKLETR